MATSCGRPFAEPTARVIALGVSAILRYHAKKYRQSANPSMTDIAILASDHPAGHRIAPHAHRRHQLIYARKGVMRVATAEGSWIVPPERALWMPARVRHAIHCSGAVSLRTIYIGVAAGRVCRDAA